MKTEKLIGKNAQIVAQIMRRQHVADSYKENIFAVLKSLGGYSFFIKYPKALRRGLLLCVWENRVQNSNLYKQIKFPPFSNNVLFLK